MFISTRINQMAEKSKTIEVTINDDSRTFNTIFKKFRSGTEYDFKGLATLRKVLSNEKAKILSALKTKKPKSIYELSKMLKRGFKSVSEDVKLLERFGFVEMIAESTGKRKRLRPVLSVSSINIQIKI